MICSDMARDQKLVGAVPLAAGAGQRFGADKLLHLLEDGVAIAARAVRKLRAATPVESMARDGFHPGNPVYRASGTALARHIATRYWADAATTAPCQR